MPHLHQTREPGTGDDRRELALRLVDLSFPPDAEQVSGAGHVFADALSRVYAPTGAGMMTLRAAYGKLVMMGSSRPCTAV
jgi:hypothetical protein